MTLDTRAYLNLSAVVYLDFDKLAIGNSIAQLIGDKVISEKDINSPEFSALQDPSNLPYQNNRLHQLKFCLEGFASLFPANDYCHIILYQAFFITVIS